MAAQVEFFWDLQGTKPIGNNFGSAIIGKTEKTIYMKNAGDYPLTNVYLQFIPTRVVGRYSYNSFKFIDTPDEIAVGQIVPVMIWQPLAGSDECTFEGELKVHCIEKKDWQRR